MATTFTGPAKEENVGLVCETRQRKEGLASALTQEASALFSACRKYRYLLGRGWDPAKPGIVFCMFNPSLASESRLDPTVTRCVNFAKSWGYGRLTVINLFAFVTPYPDELWKQPDPTGPENDWHILQAATREGTHAVVAAWGADPKAQARAAHVVDLLARRNVRLQCLGKTKAGCPRHPLYLKATTPLENYP